MKFRVYGLLFSVRGSDFGFRFSHHLNGRGEVAQVEERTEVDRGEELFGFGVQGLRFEV